jgi:multidrug resistance efflux pump
LLRLLPPQCDAAPFDPAARPSAQASLAQAKEALDLAKIQFARDEEVIGERAISKQDYDTKRNAVDVDQALHLADKIGQQRSTEARLAGTDLPW